MVLPQFIFFPSWYMGLNWTNKINRFSATSASVWWAVTASYQLIFSLWSTFQPVGYFYWEEWEVWRRKIKKKNSSPGTEWTWTSLAGLGDGKLQAIFVDAKTVVIILLKKCLKKILKLPCVGGSFMFFIRLILCKYKILCGLDSCISRGFYCCCW